MVWLRLLAFILANTCLKVCIIKALYFIGVDYITYFGGSRYLLSLLFSPLAGHMGASEKKIGVSYSGVLTVRILLYFKVLC